MKKSPNMIPTRKNHHSLIIFGIVAVLGMLWALDFSSSNTMTGYGTADGASSSWLTIIWTKVISFFKGGSTGFVVGGSCTTTADCGASEVCVSGTCQACATPPSGLVSWWPGDTNGNDLVGSNTLSATRGATFAPAKVGSGMYFPTNNFGSFVTTVDSNHPALYLNNAMTFEAWIKTDKYGTIFDNSGDHYGMLLRSDGFGGLLFRRGWDEDSSIRTIPNFFVAGEFVHLVLTTDSGVWKVYRNGVLVDTWNYTPYVSRPMPHGWAIGAFQNSHWLDGIIDEIGVYNRALTPGEIQSIFLTGGHGKCKTPISIQTTGPLLETTVGVATSQQVEATGGSPYYIYSVSSGALPAGLSLGASTGLITGIPTIAGDFSFVINVADSVNGAASSAMTLHVNAAPVGCVSPPSGLINWWPADGDLKDIVGASSILNQLGTYDAGIVGQGWIFPVRQHATMFGSYIPGINGQITFEGWIKPTYQGDGSWGVDDWQGIYTRSGVDIRTDGTLLGLIIGQQNDIIRVSDILKVGQWTHFAVTVNNGLTKIYKNGILVTTLNTNTPSYGPHYDWTTIGDYFQGTLDELSWYNRALTAVEVQSIVAAGSAGKCKVAPDDGDGIAANIDRNRVTGADESTIFSNDFNDGSTNGTITSRSGWTFSVIDLPFPLGIRILISGTGTGKASIVSCNNNVQTQLDSAGETSDITCGSTTVTATQASPTIIVREPASGTGGKSVQVKLTTGQTVTMGSFVTGGVSNTGPITVEILDETDAIIGTGSVSPGQTVNIEPNGPGGTIVINNTGAYTFAITLNGEVITLPSGGSFTDQCPSLEGNIGNTGCPVADKNVVMLHTICQGDKSLCGGSGSNINPLANAAIRVFDRNKLASNTIPTLNSGVCSGPPVTLTKNPNGQLYDDIYECAPKSAIASPGCITETDGTCYAGEATVSEFLVIVKSINSGTNAYTGLPKGSADFIDNLATKDFQFIKVLKRDGSTQFMGGSKTIFTGSYLETVSPLDAVWESDSYLYPFIFTSDSEWTVDVCAKVPTGYAIKGVYDENGQLIASNSCAQAFVAKQTKVIAFDVVDTGSPPEWAFNAKLKLKHKGKTTNADISVPTHVKGKRN